MALRPDSQALLRNAIRYAERGWPVFLLGRTKRPLANCDACKDADAEHDPAACECLTCHGFYAATTDAERVAAMVAAHPRGMLAIRTGVVADLAVVDIDPRNGGAIDYDLMLRTACVVTGGGGWHLYYRHPGGRLAAELAGHPGVDIKADGGYVVAPPSVHPGTGRPYRWAGGHPVVEMAPALIEACRPAETLPVAAPTGPTPMRRAGAISSPDALLASILGAVGRASKGGHRRAMYGAARGVARMVAASAIDQADAVAALTATGREHGQTDREIREAIKGGFRAERVPVTLQRSAA
ncbi:bifunctional DNA primase/polymerase [Dactylosporangium sp. NPDC049742]|uniref:bifunctional DNA primase/polymerase n=1 Tax=Dactylosporangium sp. NPDC049742 TaxID=3154737 RepID=UPI00341CB3A3